MTDILPRPSTSRLDDPSRRTSLCCECGNVRDVSARHYARRPVFEQGWSAVEIAKQIEHWETAENIPSEVRKRNIADLAEMKPYERCTEDLKCTPCGRVTRHAAVAPLSPEPASTDLWHWRPISGNATLCGIPAQPNGRRAPADGVLCPTCEATYLLQKAARR